MLDSHRVRHLRLWEIAQRFAGQSRRDRGVGVVPQEAFQYSAVSTQIRISPKRTPRIKIEGFSFGFAIFASFAVNQFG
jgi:hypothetical protein